MTYHRLWCLNLRWRNHCVHFGITEGKTKTVFNFIFWKDLIKWTRTKKPTFFSAHKERENEKSPNFSCLDNTKTYIKNKKQKMHKCIYTKHKLHKCIYTRFIESVIINLLLLRHMKHIKYILIYLSLCVFSWCIYTPNMKSIFILLSLGGIITMGIVQMWSWILRGQM